tara:strand:- start:316 stop:552 length:237 start_codon:yes stop_codon:yes gene_type:complete
LAETKDSPKGNLLEVKAYLEEMHPEQVLEDSKIIKSKLLLMPVNNPNKWEAAKEIIIRWSKTSAKFNTLSKIVFPISR